MEKKPIKLHILICVAAVLLYLPVLLTAQYPGAVVIPLLVAVIGYSILTVADLPAAMLALAVMTGAASLVSGNYIPVFVTALIAASSAVTDYGMRKKADFYSVILWQFGALTAVVAVTILGVRVLGNTDILSVVEEGTTQAFPDPIMNLLYRGMLLAEYTDGTSTVSTMEYMEEIMALSVEEVKAMGGELLIEAVKGSIAYVTMLGVSTVAVVTTVLNFLLWNSKAVDRPAWGLGKLGAGLPKAEDMSLPQPHGRILGILYLLGTVLWFFGVDWAFVVAVAIMPVLFCTGITFVWFYLKHTSPSKGRAVVFLILGALLCGTWLMVTAGLTDAISDFRRKFAIFIKEKEKKL